MHQLRHAILAVLVIATLSISAIGTADANSYTVARGDYLDKIARVHGTTWQQLHQANPTIKNPNIIRPGQTLEIPDAAPVAPAEPAPQPVATPAPAPEPVAEPVAAPAPPAPVQSSLTGCDLARSLINQYSWNTETAYAVMVQESSCNPNAVNWNDNHGSCSGSFGLFQISCESGQLYDPAANVAQAYSMYQARGWQPWSFLTCKIVACN